MSTDGNGSSLSTEIEVDDLAEPDAPPLSAAESVEELVDRQRVRQLLKRREACLDVLTNGSELVLANKNASREVVDQLLESAVRSYALDLAPLMQQAAAADGANVEKDYWNDHPELEARISPPERGQLAQCYPEGGEPGDEFVLRASGVSFIREHQSPVTVTWRAVRDNPGRGRNHSSNLIQTEHPLPRSLLLDVFEACDEFLGEIGLDLSLGGDVETYGVEYSELIN